MAKTFLEMPRGNLATGKKNVWAFANTPASLAANAFGRLRILPQVLRQMPWRLRVLPQISRQMLWCLRVLPQVSRQMLWRLRDSRKSRGKCFGVCGYSRKSRGKCFGVCGTPAGHFQKRFCPRVASVEVLCLHRTHVYLYREIQWYDHRVLCYQQARRLDGDGRRTIWHIGDE